MLFNQSTFVIDCSATVAEAQPEARQSVLSKGMCCCLFGLISTVVTRYRTKPEVPAKACDAAVVLDTIYSLKQQWQGRCPQQQAAAATQPAVTGSRAAQDALHPDLALLSKVEA